MDNLKGMEKFLERYNLPKLNQEEMENMNTPITSSKIETVIKNHPTNRSLGSDSFTSEFHQTFKEELTPLFPKLFKEIAEEATLPSSFYKATMVLILKPGKEFTHKKKKKFRG